MRRTLLRRVITSSLLLSLLAITLIGPTGVANALMTPVVTEEVMSIQHVGRPPDVLDLVTSRVAIPPQGQWVVDPDAGPLTFTAESGALTVTLGGGLARLERQSNSLVGEQIGPLQPGHPAVVGTGDRLVVVRGFQLTVTNDGDAPASAIVNGIRDV
jgi:hypothetical protein